MNSRTRRIKLGFLLLLVFFWSPGMVPAQPIRVVATIPDLADIARQVGKELVSVETLAQGSENPHGVPVKPSFVPRLNRADVLIVMGLDYEAHWLPALLEVASHPRILPGAAGHIDSAEGLVPVEVPVLLDRAQGDVHPKGNPHFNLDPLNGKLMARNIAHGLARNFPQHRHAFEKNLKVYDAELDRWIARWQELAAPLKGVKFVSYHKDWSYFAGRFGLVEVGTIELKPGIEPTPSHLVNLARTMQHEKVPLVVYGSQSDRIPRQLAGRAGAKVVRLFIMAGSRPETDSYIKFIDYNIRTLVDAIKNS